MNIVELKNVSKKYGERTILNHISFSVQPEEMIALIGPSGSGKSTILNMIGLLETYDSGEISISGKKLPKIESATATKIRRNTINYLFQSFALINDMTVSQNLLLAMHFLDNSPKEKMEKIKKILSDVQLVHLQESVINTLSGGEQQRIALCRTMLKPGDLILADEPTGSLDTQAAEVAFSLIQRLCQEYHKTAIIVTHNLELAKRMDRIVDLAKFK